jgi:hypothetical protein
MMPAIAIIALRQLLTTSPAVGKRHFRNFEDPWEAAEFAPGGDQLGVTIRAWMWAP